MAECPEGALARPTPLARWIEDQGMDWEAFAIALVEGEAPTIHRCAGRYFVRPVSHHLWCVERRIRGRTPISVPCECEGAAS